MYIKNNNTSDVFNLGNGNGFSVREVINTVKKVTATNIIVQESDRRFGDPPILISSSRKSRNILHWIPKYRELETIIQHAWKWYCKKAR